MSVYKKGDKITVSLTCEISQVLDSGDLAVIHGDGRVGMVWKSALDSPTCTITRIEPPIKVGDRVRVKNGGGQMGTVKAVDGNQCWVLWDDCTHITYSSDQLERIT